MAARVLQALPHADRVWFPSWLERRAAQLNASIADAFGARLQLVELFAGIGGLGSGIERALDAVPILQAEAVAERRAVLASHFPLALQVDDVHRLLEMPAPAPADRLVVAGGFPCRGMSQANLTGARGFAHPQSGLWSVMIEVIRRWSPRAVIVENVIGLRARGLREVLPDLVSAGYATLWGVDRASDFGAPHDRARLFIVAVRPELAPVHPQPRSPRADWRPWAGPIPANDHHTPGGQARVAALGDAVVPIVAYTVRLTAGRLMGGWRPAVDDLQASHSDKPPLTGRPRFPSDGPRFPSDGPQSLNDRQLPPKGGHRFGNDSRLTTNDGQLPLNGWLENGRMFALKASPFAPEARVTARRWVVVDQRFELQGRSLDSCIYPPAVGRIRWWDGVSDNVDVELPGGEVMPVPPGWVREGPWPTPTANDGRNLGSTSQYRRNAPGLNTLAQADCWIAEDGCYATALIDHFSGRGVGPGFLEWAMGFPPGWTAMQRVAHSSRAEHATPVKLKRCD